MNRLFITLLLGLLLAACTPEAASPQPTEVSTPAVTPPITAARWLSVEVEGVTLSIRVPDDWEAVENEDGTGLVLVEHALMVDNQPPNGILINIFVPALTGIDIPGEGDNVAHRVLHEVAQSPEYIGDSHVTAITPFVWDGHHAAYYLLSSPQRIDSMVLAVTLPDGQIVVCNIATPSHNAHRIREMLPRVLEHLKINGKALDPDALESLPDTLHFPHDVAATESAAPTD